MAQITYARNAGAVFSLKYHVIWCPKYRRRVLTPVVASRLKVLFVEIAEEFGFAIVEQEIMPDHVHLLIEADPTQSVAKLAQYLKGATSRFLRQEFPQLRRLPGLWSRSYFAGAVGGPSEDIVRRYIQQQKAK